eukprot:UN30908
MVTIGPDWTGNYDHNPNNDFWHGKITFKKLTLEKEGEPSSTTIEGEPTSEGETDENGQIKYKQYAKVDRIFDVQWFKTSGYAAKRTYTYTYDFAFQEIQRLSNIEEEPRYLYLRGDCVKILKETMYKLMVRLDKGDDKLYITGLVEEARFHPNDQYEYRVKYLQKHSVGYVWLFENEIVPYNTYLATRRLSKAVCMVSWTNEN